MLRFYIFTLLNILLSQTLSSQIVISGIVLDPLSREVLPYVNIGIKNKNIGTTSLSDGSFTITIPSKNENDSLTFSLIGYSDLKIPIKNSTKKTIPLFRKPELLQEVDISVSRLSEKKFGLKKRSPVIHFIDGSMNKDDIFEIAQLVKLPAASSKLSSVNLFINETTEDTITFRINIYSYSGYRPAERLNTQPILQKQILKEGWLHCDISKLNLHAKNEVVIAIEFLPSKQRKKSIAYEVKLGGRTKSFFRKNSQGEWIVPPHHYLMYLRALVALKEQDSEEEEKEPSILKKLFSEFVKDSFSLFVYLPNSYQKSKNKNYPVVFLLDANAYFDLVCDFWNPKNKIILPEAIIVGIAYKDALQMDSLRQRDYTFPKAIPDDSCTLSGGAGKFRDFIYKELIPFIHKSYRIQSDELILMGHSLGGYFPAFCLVKDLKENNTLIKNYICISPSLDYADTYLLKDLKTMNTIKSNSQLKKCYVCFGDKEEEMITTTQGVLKEFEEHLKFPGISLKWDVFPAMTHMETPVPGFEQGLRFVLKTDK